MRLVSGFYGTANYCTIVDTITLGGTPSDLAQFLCCFLGTTAVGLVEIDMNGDGPALAMRAYTGGVTVKNKTGNSKVAIDFLSGRLEIAATVTAGTFYVRGVGEISENLGTGITLFDAPLINPATVSDSVWDEAIADHGAAGSFGQALGGQVVLAGTASAGSSTSITLTGGIATDGIYDGCLVVITGGAGFGQSRTILSYLDTTVATVTRDWVTPPDGTSKFVVVGGDVPAVLEAGTAQAGGAASITLDAAASDITGTYRSNFIMVTAGTGMGQTRLIKNYAGATRIATVTPGWTTQPTAGSVYQIIPGGRVDVGEWEGIEVPSLVDTIAQVSDAVWDETAGDHVAAGTFGAMFEFLKQIEGGRWKIDTATNIMTFYEDDNTTVVAQFNLLGSDGLPASEDVYERTRV